MNIDDLMKVVSDPSLYIIKPIKDEYYCTWNPNNGINREWNKIWERTDPIQYVSFEKRIEKHEDKDGGDERKDPHDFKQQKRINTGYIRPYFRFLDIRIFLREGYPEDMLTTFEKLNRDTSEFGMLERAHLYRQTLTLQIKRQARKVESINREMTDILKVCFHEGIQIILSETERNEIIEPNQMPDLRFFYRDVIMHGEYPDHIEEYWIPKAILSLDYLPELLKKSSAQGLLKLAEDREPYLIVAENIARQLLSVETIIERLLMGKDFSDLELAIRNMPDPQEVARQFYNNATNPQYETEVVSRVMGFTRDFIFRKGITQETLNVSEIKKEIERRNIVDFSDQTPTKNTIRNWIKKYAELALSTS